MKTPKIKQREVVKIQYYVYCPVCDKEITGTAPDQIEYNLKLHLDKHKKEDKRK